MTDSYGILINTCDKFEDCWHPYFKLHTLYWPDCKVKLYLNTEKKDFSYPGLDIVALKVNAINNRDKITWSECLIRALDRIEEDIVLYMQEDYFLKAPVANELVDQYVQLMHENPSIHCIHLTDQGPVGEFPSENDASLWTVSRINKDRVSCQAALWRKEVLRSYIRMHESAWNFEWFGSKRASVVMHNFFAVDRLKVKLNCNEIIPYLFTGVIGGRWNKEVVNLFDNNSIVIDYSQRGFFEPNKRTFWMRLKGKIRRIPVELHSYLDLFVLKMRSGYFFCVKKD